MAEDLFKRRKFTILLFFTFLISSENLVYGGRYGDLFKKIVTKTLSSFLGNSEKVVRVIGVASVNGLIKPLKLALKEGHITTSGKALLQAFANNKITHVIHSGAGMISSKNGKKIYMFVAHEGDNIALYAMNEGKVISKEIAIKALNGKEFLATVGSIISGSGGNSKMAGMAIREVFATL